MDMARTQSTRCARSLARFGRRLRRSATTPASYAAARQRHRLPALRERISHDRGGLDPDGVQRAGGHRLEGALWNTAAGYVTGSRAAPRRRLFPPRPRSRLRGPLVAAIHGRFPRPSSRRPRGLRGRGPHHGVRLRVVAQRPLEASEPHRHPNIRGLPQSMKVLTEDR